MLKATNFISFSINMGLTWELLTISEDPILVEKVEITNYFYII